MQLERRTVSINDLLLDPNNYRFHDLKGWKRVTESRFHEVRVQERALGFLTDTLAFELKELKDSIRTNGLVPLEQIVVRSYEHDPTKFVVVEGNRRVAAIKSLLDEHANGIVDLSSLELDRLRTLEVLILDLTNPDNAQAGHVLMAIRHVSGVKQWGAYQQAGLIVELRDQEGASFKTVAERLGMSPQEVARRYRASRALAQMEGDDEYKECAEPRMYAIFHETVAQPSVREWLGWDDRDFCFTKHEELHHFYSLIAGIDEQPAKIRGYEDIRSRLVPILRSQRAIQTLLDPTKTLEDAHQTAIEDAGTSNSNTNFELPVQIALRTLQALSIDIVRGLTASQLSLLTSLADRIKRTLDDHRVLSRADE
jgi:ParB-like nuclease family protein